MTGSVRRASLAPPAGTPLALLLIGLALVSFAAWPDRPADANRSWFAVAIARHVGLILVAATLAFRLRPRRDAASQLRDAVALTFAWALSLPFEALAYFGSAPSESLVWSLAISAPAAGFVYVASALLASGANRLRIAWALPMLVPGVALALGLVDVRTGPVLLLPWLLPFAPSWAAAVVLGGSVLVALVLALMAWRRQEGSS